MCMSTITKNVNEQYFKAFCKGSPEKIKEICKDDSVPANFNQILTKYTTKGFRVLALSAKLLKMDYLQSQKIERKDIESNMIFLGLLIVQNKLKEKTTSSIVKLDSSKLRMVMATGDNLLTAISVAKECNLINPEASVFTCKI
jgi:cation-transporting ATPase 13A2